MIQLNSLILNGKSSADFPFFVAVEEVPGVTLPVKKDKVYQHEHMSGAVKQSINAWEPLQLEFIFYLHDVTRKHLRDFKGWFKPEGTLSRYDDPDMHYEYISVDLTSKPLDELDGYQVTATFLCQPFEYEREVEVTVGSSILNATTAPMYPKLTIKGNTTSESYIRIGNQNMYFKEGITNGLIIECKHGYQNVWNLSGTEINNQIKGDFFEILPGTHPVTKGTGITEVKMLTRWGWR